MRLDPFVLALLRPPAATSDPCPSTGLRRVFATKALSCDQIHSLPCRFRENFATTPWVKVPEVMWQYTTSEVLTMEYAPGVKINRIDEIEAMGLDRCVRSPFPP